MTGLDAAVLAERSAAVQRHLRRVRERLPDDAAQLRPMSDAVDAVVLHLWQAVQIVIDVAVWACVGLGLGRRRPTERVLDAGRAGAPSTTQPSPRLRSRKGAPHP